MTFGVPYMGSKNKIAPMIVDALPASECFVDLFAGGCAITHAAMLTGKWSTFIANDISDIPKLFKDAIDGRYHDERRWITREDFFAIKDTDPYVRTCWSFGNDCKTYMYAPEVERIMHAMFDVCFASTPHDTRMALHRFFRILFKSNWFAENIKTHSGQHHMCEIRSLERLENIQSLESLERIQSLESLKRLERIQSLERLQRIQSLESLTISQADYRDVIIPPNSTVYCDIPYKDTKNYACGAFNHEEFYEWVRTRDFPVYISEYTAPDDFVSVWSKEHYSSLGSSQAKSGTAKRTTEQIFVYERWATAHTNSTQPTNEHIQYSLFDDIA